MPPRPSSASRRPDSASRRKIQGPGSVAVAADAVSPEVENDLSGISALSDPDVGGTVNSCEVAARPGTAGPEDMDWVRAQLREQRQAEAACSKAQAQQEQATEEAAAVHIQASWRGRLARVSAAACGCGSSS